MIQQSVSTIVDQQRAFQIKLEEHILVTERRLTLVEERQAAVLRERWELPP